jgi:hypothetical protein
MENVLKELAQECINLGLGNAKKSAQLNHPTDAKNWAEFLEHMIWIEKELVQ